MKKLIDSFAALIVPAGFLVAAIFLFRQGNIVAGGVCIVVAFLTARN